MQMDSFFKNKLKIFNIFQKQLLYGFLYIPEAEYATGHCTSFFKVQSFCQNEIFSSKLITDTDNPVFDFLHVSVTFFLT